MPHGRACTLRRHIDGAAPRDSQRGTVFSSARPACLPCPPCTRLPGQAQKEFEGTGGVLLDVSHATPHPYHGRQTGGIGVPASRPLACAAVHAPRQWGAMLLGAGPLRHVNAIRPARAGCGCAVQARVWAGGRKCARGVAGTRNAPKGRPSTRSLLLRSEMACRSARRGVSQPGRAAACTLCLSLAAALALAVQCSAGRPNVSCHRCVCMRV